MLGRTVLETRYLMMPDPQTVVLYRIGNDDSVVDSKKVDFVERRNTSHRETAGIDGPTLSLETTFCLWSVPLAGWIPKQRDRICHLKIDGSQEWFIIESTSIELQGARFRCTCNPSGGVLL